MTTVEPIAAIVKPLEVGDPVPWFTQRATNVPEFFFPSVAGRITVVCAFGSAAPGRPGEGLIPLFLAHRELFDDVRATVLGVSVDPNDERSRRVRQALPGFRCLWDMDRRASRALRTVAANGAADAYDARTIVVDERLSVVASVPITGSPDAHVATVVAIVQALGTRPEPSPAALQAPVLVVPRVFEPELCRALIDHYDSNDPQPSGTMVSVGRQTRYQLNVDRKRRADVELPDGHVLRQATLDRVRRRVIPAIAQAYQFRATRIERYVVACYTSAERGFFVAHRDNTTTGTAHRRFAVSVGLNDDYDGGELVFAEYGNQRFRVPHGGAVVFGCSMLHEVREVTRGDRYVFLPFLYDDAAAEVRAANLRHLDRSGMR